MKSTHIKGSKDLRGELTRKQEGIFIWDPEISPGPVGLSRLFLGGYVLSLCSTSHPGTVADPQNRDWMWLCIRVLALDNKHEPLWDPRESFQEYDSLDESSK